MTTNFRVIDTGMREGRANIAFDQAMIESHRAGKIPDSIRFIRFPPTALIGRHQALSHEVSVDYCRQNNIGIARRITGGGAIYFDEGQLGWSLVFHRAILGIASLGIFAKPQPTVSAASASMHAIGRVTILRLTGARSAVLAGSLMATHCSIRARCWSI